MLQGFFVNEEVLGCLDLDLPAGSRCGLMMPE